ncbi:MAG: hypothetical protein ACOC0P_00420 [Planctomycetota bacterium]
MLIPDKAMLPTPNDIHSIILASLGVLLVVLSSVDLLSTTLHIARGGGPITQRLSHALWRTLLAIHQRRRIHCVLTHGGLVIVLMILLCWLLMLWFGWALIYVSDPSAVILSDIEQPVGFLDRLLFAGLVMFSLGQGSWAVDDPLWHTVSVLTVGSGVIFLTLAITYLVPFVSAAVDKRSLAGLLWAAGETPEELIDRACDAERAEALASMLQTLTERITQLSQKYLSYPMLYFVHSADLRLAIGPRIAALDEAISIMRHGCNHGVHVDPVTLESTSRSVTLLLDTLARLHLRSKPDEPRIPRLSKMSLPACFEPVSDATFAERMHDLRERRSTLAAFVRRDGWSWGDIFETEAVDPDEPKQDA